jgi:hypothetical protein
VNFDCSCWMRSEYAGPAATGTCVIGSIALYLTRAAASPFEYHAATR